MIHVKRNGGTEPGMYGLTVPVHGTSANVVTIHNDIMLCERLRAEGVDLASINHVVQRLQRRDDGAMLERSGNGEWKVTFGTKRDA